MKQSKRLFALLLTLAMTLGMLTACGGGNSDTSSEGDGGESSGSNELTVYTAFPEAEVAYYFNAFEAFTMSSFSGNGPASSDRNHQPYLQ